VGLLGETGIVGRYGKIGRIEMVGIAEIAGITGIAEITERIGNMVYHRGAVALWVTPAGAKRSPGGRGVPAKNGSPEECLNISPQKRIGRAHKGATSLS